LQAQIEQAKAQTALIQAQLDALDDEAALKQAQTDQIRAEIVNLGKQGYLIEAQTAVQTNTAANEILQGTVLVAQECLLRAQFDNTAQTTLKTGAETDLLKQKIVTEKAQTLELGVDDNSVIGRQKALYAAQKDGFQRDAEQKAVKIWTDTWNARRMTDEGTVADGVNMLADVTGGRLMNKLLTGIGA
jgi:hypothetical protein